MKKMILILTVIAMMIPTHLFAQGAESKSLISTFDNAIIVYDKTVKWDTYILPISKIKNKGGKKGWDKKLKLEGKVNRIQYTTDKSNTASLVYTNYLSALKKSNWEILFSGSGENELGNNSYEWQYYMFQEGLGLDKKYGGKYGFSGDDNYAYIAAKFADNDRSYYAMIYIIEKNTFTMINQDIVTIKNPDLGLVTAKLLTEKIDEKGHLALDGIFFKTGKATLTEKSIPALKNISKYLNSNKGKKYFIVGHTDNVGNFAANMTLSKNRAKAVMNELISKYGVSSEQLKASGVANFSPMVSNTTDEGKAKNRRVEIVEQ